MKTLANVVTLLVVLGFCLPSYGDILVYKFSFSGNYYELQDGEWQMWKKARKGYMVLDFNYGTHSIEQAEVITYWTHWKDQDGKWFQSSPLNLELVRVEYGTKIQWVVMQKNADVVGEEVVGGQFVMLTGSVRERNIGVEVKREVAATLSGYNLFHDVDRDIEMSKVSLAFYPAWTSWANDPDEGNQDFDAAKQKVVTYLEARGYTETE